MRVIATVLVIVLLVGWVEAHGHAAGPLGATVAELVRPLVEAVRELFAWPTLQPGGAESYAKATKRSHAVVLRSSKVEVNTTSAEGNAVNKPGGQPVPPEATEQPSVQWRITCAPDEGFYVPKEVFATREVCDDHSLGVPLQVAEKLSREELDARLEAIRQRYLPRYQEYVAEHQRRRVMNEFARQWGMWWVSCSSGRYFYVPREVRTRDLGDVCTDPSLGIPAAEAEKLSPEEIKARADAILKRYRGESGN